MSDTSTQKTSEWAERELGALWKKESSNQKYLSGKLKMPDGTSQGVVVFTNRHKAEGSNQPDFRVYRDRPMDSSEDSSPPAAQQQDEGIL